MGMISPSQMLGLDARLHDPTGPDHSAHPVSSVNLRASASLTRSTESLHASSNDSTNTGDAVLRKIVQEKNLAAEQASTPHGADGAKLMVQSRPKTTEVQSAGPKKRPGHARKHSM